MRLPGTRYQEHGWEQVRKLLGQCSLQAFQRLGLRQPELDAYTDAMAEFLGAAIRSSRAGAPGNSYGDSVGELALSLLFELQAHPAFWQAFTAVLPDDGACGEAMLRKKVNDMYAGLRDKVDADNYIAATGRDCSPNRIYTYRMLDMAYRDIAALFANWQANAAQVGAILGRELHGSPIEVRQMRSIAGCKPEWIVRWSETLERHTGSPGPLHTRSKRFSSLKNSPDNIAAMLVEIGDYEELSANMDRADDWQAAAGEASAWLEDYWRVMGESEAAASLDEDRILAAPPQEALQQAWEPALEEAEDGGQRPGRWRQGPGERQDRGRRQEWEQGQDLRQHGEPVGGRAWLPGEEPGPPSAGLARPQPDALQLAAEQAVAEGLSLPPRYLELARAAQDAGSWTLRMLAQESLPIRLAVYHKLLGAADDTYPQAWLHPDTGELPTLQQLAALDGISMPTLRKRRNEAIAKLQAAGAAARR
ncbi:hypothetical protein ACLB1G_05960 [Oxalobacteraceae bacterium A2-2]